MAYSLIDPSILKTQVVKNILHERVSRPVILCVDDDPMYLQSLTNLISDAHDEYFSIQSADNGAKALELIKLLQDKNNQIAVIVSDQIMPGMKGDAFLAEAHQLVPQAIKIMLTGQVSDLDNLVQALNKANLFRFVHKTDNDSFYLKQVIDDATKIYFQQQLIHFQTNNLHLLNRAAYEFSQDLNVNQVVEELAVATYAAVQVPYISIFLIENGQVVMHSALKEGKKIAISEANWAAQALFEQLQSNPRLVLREKENFDFKEWTQMQSAIILPLFEKAKLIGFLYAADDIFPEVFGEDVISVLQTLAGQAAVSIDNALIIQNLEEHVKERTISLEESTQKALELATHKDKMIQIVSHDIRSPLTGIASLANLLTNPEAAKDSEKVLKYAEIMERDIQNVVRFVNDLLDLGKLESGLVLYPKETKIKEWLESLAKNYESTVLTKGINLHVNSEDFSLSMDAGQMQQALHNLISNAFKFTNKGGNIHVKATKENGKAIIQIKDSGLGIPSEDLPKVFEKFGVKQRKGTSGEKGTGLGLSIVQQIVQLHHGEIKVESQIGVGTTFTISLPLS